MSKFVKLLTSAYVNGALRHPHEGGLHLEDDEAKRLLDNEAAIDVSSDFSADQVKETPVEALTAEPVVAASVALAGEAVDHQANAPLPEAQRSDKSAAHKAKKETEK